MPEKLIWWLIQFYSSVLDYELRRGGKSSFFKDQKNEEFFPGFETHTNLDLNTHLHL